jgi:hypothetical protein
MSLKGLGKDFDVCAGVVPVADLAGGAQTGLRLHMKNYGGCAIVAFMGAVSAGTDTFVPDIQQHDAASAGNSKDLDVVTEWYIKSETTLDGDEAWTKVTQSVASEISLTGATYAATQLLLVAQIDAASLDLANNYEWISVIQADPGTGGTRAGGYLYIPYDLKVQRAPQNLPQPQA